MEITVDSTNDDVSCRLTFSELEQVASGLMLRAARLQALEDSNMPGDWLSQKAAVESLRSRMLGAIADIEDRNPDIRLRSAASV